MLFRNRELLPPIILFLILLFIPFISLLGGGATGSQVGAVEQVRIAITNFDLRQLSLFGRSLSLSVAAALLAGLLGVPLGLLLARDDLPAVGALRLACVFPLFLPPYLQAMIWSKYADGCGVLLPEAWVPVVQHLVYGPCGVIWVFFLSFGALVPLLVLVGVKSRDRLSFEAATMARSRSAVQARILIPQVVPHIGAAMLLVFLFSLVNFEVPDLLRVRVFPVEIFLQFSAFYNEQQAVALSLPLVCVALLPLIGQQLLMRGKNYFNLHSASLSKNHPGGYLPARKRVWLAYFFVLTAIVIPLLGFVLNAGNPADSSRALAESLGSFVYSLSTAAAAAALAVLAVLPLSYYIARRRNFTAAIFDCLSQFPLAVPPIVIGIGLVQAYNSGTMDWLYNSPGFLVFGLVVAHGPFAVKIMSAAWSTIAVDQEQAAWLAVGSRGRIFRTVLLPLLLPGMGMAFLTVFAFALANLGVALLVMPPGSETLPLRIYNYLHYGALNQVYAINLMLLLSLGLSMGLLAALVRWRSGRWRDAADEFASDPQGLGLAKSNRPTGPKDPTAEPQKMDRGSITRDQ